MSNPLKIATLSFWHVHAGDYSRQVDEHPGTELVAVWDDDAERGREGAAKFGAEYAADLDAVLARDDLDGVVITTPTDAHRDVMVRAARAGKHIFTEKVLAPTVAEADEIVAATDAAGVKLTVSLPRLYHGYTTAIREVLDKGTLGRLTYGRVRLSHDGAIARDGKDGKDGWLPQRFFEPKAAIGGALTDLGCHPVYLTQLFLGANPETVSATYRSVAGLGLEDNAVVVAGYGDQKIGVIEAGFASSNPFTIELFGTEGTLTYTDAGNVLTVNGEQVPVPEHSTDAFAQWVDHINNGTRADENIERAVELTRLVVAANAAAESGQAIVYS
ncbi:Gfo/Idh/MocA family oxidoreductase [Kribbella solani]|uniref:Gfo/Idh/MocA family protein n=1 Tax=Kribbella solani TaxID=236067 RepID=UPI0029B4AA4B|nr:Gfo/Idh/MocA family oxidoreductase [Kribbella solani]MDX3006165.1 Gfo/Idh/MocA family oxidoreductase [Kribbella solani]